MPTIPSCQWVMVTVVHSRGRFMRKSEFSVYVDGFLKQTVQLKFPNVSEVCAAPRPLRFLCLFSSCAACLFLWIASLLALHGTECPCPLTLVNYI